MPPDVREWLPANHLAWFVIDAVGEMDLDAFYAAYRFDGRSRPPDDPAMMVALLLYAYARGVPSSRQVERSCVEDVAFRVIAGQKQPDHATIARFVSNHQDALAGLFGEVLTLCARSGLAKVGVIAIDGTKVQANASRNENLDYEQIARELVERAIATDAAEDELYGEARGDELPEQWRSGNGRRDWLRGAKQRLEAERAANPQAVERDRPKRLKQAKRRLDEELWTEVRANAQYEAYRARGVMRDGRPIPNGHSVPKPYTPPPVPEGRINITDPDSKVVKGLRGWIQGYNAQAATNEHQIVLAAEIDNVGADFGHLEPMLDAAQRELAHAGVEETPGVLLADAGYWHSEQMANVVNSRHPSLDPARHHPPPADQTQLGRRPLRLHAQSPGHRLRRRALQASPADDRARVRPGEVQPRARTLQTPRPRRCPHRMAPDHRHPQPPQAPPPHPHHRLSHPGDRRRRGNRKPHPLSRRSPAARADLRDSQA